MYKRLAKRPRGSVFRKFVKGVIKKVTKMYDFEGKLLERQHTSKCELATRDILIDIHRATKTAYISGAK